MRSAAGRASCSRAFALWELGFTGRMRWAVVATCIGTSASRPAHAEAQPPLLARPKCADWRCGAQYASLWGRQFIRQFDRQSKAVATKIELPSSGPARGTLKRDSKLESAIGEFIKRFGILGVVGAIVLGCVVWYAADRSAASGSSVRILWGLVEYTKASDPNTATPLPRPAAKSMESNDPARSDKNPILTRQGPSRPTLESLRKEHSLRELGALEAGRSLDKSRKETFAFIQPTMFASIFRAEGVTFERQIRQSRADRYPAGGAFEVHHLANGNALLVGFTSESDASRLATLDGQSSVEVSMSPTPETGLSVITAIPIQRIARLMERRVEFERGIRVDLPRSNHSVEFGPPLLPVHHAVSHPAFTLGALAVRTYIGSGYDGLEQSSQRRASKGRDGSGRTRSKSGAGT